MQKKARFKICSHLLIPIELMNYILLSYCKTPSHSCSSLHAGDIPKQKSKTQTTAVKTTNQRWKEVSSSEKKLSSCPLCLPAMGSQQKNHYCLRFLQHLHLEIPPLLQCDWWLIHIFYPNSDVSFPWKFWWICYCDTKDSHGWPPPNTTQCAALSPRDLILTCSCLCSAKANPFHTSQVLFF